MTRDLDLVISLGEHEIEPLVEVFASDFYVDADDVRSAVVSQRQFNLMHLASGIKVDLIVRKASEYRQVEFARRRAVTFAGVKTWIVTRCAIVDRRQRRSGICRAMGQATGCRCRFEQSQR